MFRSVALARVQRVFVAAARQKALEEAEAGGWPLPPRLAVELWLYEQGFRAG
ncbi:MAG TPA: hypothetical protein VGB13_00155 [Candidatus Krumholzibacteria bacterium]|jgi:hypothetical protein